MRWDKSSELASTKGIRLVRKRPLKRLVLLILFSDPFRMKCSTNDARAEMSQSDNPPSQVRFSSNSCATTGAMSRKMAHLGSCAPHEMVLCQVAPIRRHPRSLEK